MKTPPPVNRVARTRQRLLDAASRVFARDGLGGATTRAIAREAGVNEVTLFRHFQSKDRLLAAVVGSNFGPQTKPESPAVPVLAGELRADLLIAAARYDTLLTENLPLIRTMIGEIQRHGDHERQVFKAVFQPLREAFLKRIALAQSEGELRAELDLQLLADLFFGMIFTGVLRRSASHIRLAYSHARYLEAAVDLVLRGATE